LDKKLSIGPSEYNKSGFDKGHMSPAEDMAYSSESMLECFYMTNMCPQLPNFNRGIWKALENYVREIALEYDSICVITGPVLSKDMKTFGNNIGIPKTYFKVIYIYKLHTAIAFYLDNVETKNHSNIRNYQTTVEEVENITVLKFFNGLPENKIKEVKFNKILNID
jgi:endonuclease G